MFLACHAVCFFSSTVWFLVHGSWFAKREAKSFYGSRLVLAFIVRIVSFFSSISWFAKRIAKSFYDSWLSSWSLRGVEMESRHGHRAAVIELVIERSRDGVEISRDGVEISQDGAGASPF